MNHSLIRRPEAFLPVLMSTLAIAMVAVHAVFHGVAVEEDEGTLAHIFQLLLVLQLPIIFTFLLKWYGRERAQVLWILVLEIVLATLAVLAVIILT